VGLFVGPASVRVGAGTPRAVFVEDLRVSAKTIMQQWQARKLSHAVALRDLLACRDPAAQRYWQFVGAVSDGEEQAEYRRGMSVVLAKTPSLLGSFRGHAAIDLWQRQFEPPEMERLLRFRPLLLRGQSRSGKTCKAQSLYGIEDTLLVNCQGLKDCLPSIRAFQRSVHKAILWDEISPAQVCANKLIFQSGPMPITLAQSACNGFAYDKWLYGVRHILCSNMFWLVAEPGVKGGLSAEDSEWLQANIIVADLEPGEVWFVRKTSAASMSQSSRVTESSPERPSRVGWASLPIAQ